MTEGPLATAIACVRQDGSVVMAVPGLDPGISPGHPRLATEERRKVVDARLKAGHDGAGVTSVSSLPRHGRARPGHPRLATEERRKDVDARLKAGHDGSHGRARPGHPRLWKRKLPAPD